MRYAGLDIHRQVCHAVAMDDRGQVVKEGRFENRPENYLEFFKGLEGARVAMRQATAGSRCTSLREWGTR
ncbi:MAG: hypothetical protein QW356_03465 [Candidatus Hadarchaeales archaeon]